MNSKLFKALANATTDSFPCGPTRRALRRAVRCMGAGAALVLVVGCGADDTAVVTGGTTSGSGGSSSTAAGSGGSGTGGSIGSGGSGGSASGTAGSGGTSAGAGGAGGAGGSAGGAGGSSGAGGAGGGGVCITNPGKALQFNGNVNDILSGDLGADFPGGDVPRTIELWAKFLDATSWKVEGSIIETGLAMGGPNRVLGIDISGYTAATMTAEFGPYTNGYSDNNHAPPPGGVFVPMIPQAGWLHLSWSYTGNNGTLSFTVNGVEYPVTTAAGPPTLNFFPGIVTLAASQTFGTVGWTGVMDEVRLWRVAKTPAEILRDMRVVLKGTEPGLVAYYRFEEGTGTFTDDVSMTMTHRLSACTAMSTRCFMAVNTASPQWVTSDIPGTFTCAP